MTVKSEYYDRIVERMQHVVIGRERQENPEIQMGPALFAILTDFDDDVILLRNRNKMEKSMGINFRKTINRTQNRQGNR